MTFTLYVGRDKSVSTRHDLGSTLCLSMLERWASHTITVHLATDISPRDRPYWLRGTPTLVDDDGTVTSGFAAYQKITDLAFAAQRPPAASPAASGPQPSARAARAVAEPPSQPSPDEGDDDLDRMWESQGDLEGESEPALGGPSKLSQDDFAQAMMGRGGTRPSLTEAPAGPPPMLEPLKD